MTPFKHESKQYLHYFRLKSTKITKSNCSFKKKNYIITSVISRDNSDFDPKMIIKRLLSLPLN